MRDGVARWQTSARHFVNKLPAAAAPHWPSAAVWHWVEGGGGVETRRLRRERETVGEKVCSQHPARETLTLDRPSDRAATMPASPAPTHLASQAEQKAKMQNYKNIEGQKLQKMQTRDKNTDKSF